MVSNVWYINVHEDGAPPCYMTAPPVFLLVCQYINSISTFPLNKLVQTMKITPISNAFIIIISVWNHFNFVQPFSGC